MPRLLPSIVDRQVTDDWTHVPTKCWPKPPVSTKNRFVGGGPIDALESSAGSGLKIGSASFPLGDFSVLNWRGNKKTGGDKLVPSGSQFALMSLPLRHQRRFGWLALAQCVTNSGLRQTNSLKTVNAPVKLAHWISGLFIVFYLGIGVKAMKES